jgi:hypothetical protein
LAISTANATKINHMNRASHNVSLGTVIQDLQSGSATLNGFIRASGSTVLGATDASASTVTIDPSLTGIKGWAVQAYSSGSLKTTTVKVTSTGSALTVYTGVLTPQALKLNDYVNWIIW